MTTPKTIKLSILIAMFIIAATAHLAGQDALFSQFDFAPLHLNPANTGSQANGTRVLSVYRNQWQSVLDDASYRTLNLSMDTRLALNSKNELGVGVSGLFDRSGSLNFRNSKYSALASYSYYLKHTKESRSKITLGVEAGRGVSKIDSDNIMEPIEERADFWDFGLGSIYSYGNARGHEVRLGVSIFHVNRPNVSFFENGHDPLLERVHIHGSYAFPVVRDFKMKAEAIHCRQGSAGQSILRLATSRFLPRQENSIGWQVGLFGKLGNQFQNNKYLMHSWGIDCQLRIKNALLGASWDRHRELESNSYELSLGYVFRTWGIDPAVQEQ